MDINSINPKWGEIWMCNLGTDYIGSIQGGRRPVFILSNDKNNKYSPNVNVMPLTTKMDKRRLPVHVELWNYEECGLKKPSTIMAESILTISKDSLEYKMGQVSDGETLNKICTAIGVQFAFIKMSHAGVQ